MNQETININILDDYLEDKLILEGEIQENYAYIESKISDEKSKEILEYLKYNIQKI